MDLRTQLVDGRNWLLVPVALPGTEDSLWHRTGRRNKTPLCFLLPAREYPQSAAAAPVTRKAFTDGAGRALSPVATPVALCPHPGPRPSMGDGQHCALGLELGLGALAPLSGWHWGTGPWALTQASG